MSEEIKKKIEFKRICEAEFHEVVELQTFEECPICHSKSIHLNTIVKDETRNPN